MKSILIPLSYLLFFVGVCSALENSPKVPPKPERSYLVTKSKVDSLKKSCRALGTSRAGEILATYIDKQIVPHWIGTPWDFNGVTQIPKKGKIACGYFVTTVLRDAGVKISRVKMAQCASETMINSLTKNKVNYSGLSFDSFIKRVKSKGKGIAVIGLDYHTGFLYHDGKELWFIHSSFIGRKGVVKEKASDHRILSSSKYKVVGFISQDASFIREWKKN